MSELTEFDDLLKDDGPAALVIREHLMPAEGNDGVVFPATFASADYSSGGYNIDDGPNGTNVCLIDSVGSQANRIEPMFAQEKYAELIPQIVIKAGEKSVSILDASHRAGDALVRCSSLQKEFQDAFKEVLKGNAEPLARIAPTSIVFGVWDSRDTQAKLPRLVSSTIRAFNVRKLTRSSQYIPALEYVKDQLLEEPVDRATRNSYAVRGFTHVPASGSHGGVIADGGIRRDATLSLAALRTIHSREVTETQDLQRYILGLALTAFTAGAANYLRQGCLLVTDPEKNREFVEVYGDGKRVPSKTTHEMALAFAKEAAKAFAVGKSREVPFEKERAKKDVKPEAKVKKAGK